MDALGQHIVLATAPLEITLMRVALHGSLTAAGNPMAHLTVVRELSILSIGTPLRVRSRLWREVQPFSLRQTMYRLRVAPSPPTEYDAVFKFEGPRRKRRN